MANLFAYLLAAAGPLVKKALIALGIGWLSFEGVTAALNVVRDNIIAHWGSMSSVVTDLLSLGGFNESLGIILGALAARAALMIAEKLGKVA